MVDVVILDSGPVGVLCNDPRKPEPLALRRRLDELADKGVLIVIPLIVDYEARREQVRRKASVQLERLDALMAEFVAAPVSRDALIQAAEFWAIVRQEGRPTAPDDALDADAIIAGIAATLPIPDVSVVIATENIDHFARFPGIDAQRWQEIT